jgi:hypothetical protein
MNTVIELIISFWPIFVLLKKPIELVLEYVCSLLVEVCQPYMF